MKDFFFLVTNNGFSTLGARGFSCAVSGFGQALKSDRRGFAARVFGLRPTKRSSPSHTRKNLWYPWYDFSESRERKTLGWRRGCFRPGNSFPWVSGGSSVSVSLLIMRFCWTTKKSIKRRHLERQRFARSAVQIMRSLISWKPAVNFNWNFLYLYLWLTTENNNNSKNDDRQWWQLGQASF